MFRKKNELAVVGDPYSPEAILGYSKLIYLQLPGGCFFNTFTRLDFSTKAIPFAYEIQYGF
jgi:hypothetical protein